DYDTGSAYSAAYYTFFANIRFNWTKEQCVHTLLLCPPATYTGQATVAANVAIAAAKSGTPTILVDADLRAPGLERRFGMEKGEGLRDLLAKDIINPQVVRPHLRAPSTPSMRLLSPRTADDHAPLPPPHQRQEQ